MPSLREKKQWKLTLAYDGTEFHGWQIQPGLPTIQSALADAIARVTGERVLPQGSGRTDAGVHALGQVASFPLAAPIPADNLRRALNRILPPAIRIVAAEEAAQNFHARHSAVDKVYQYRIFEAASCSPFLVRYVCCCRWPLDLTAMRQAAKNILAEHDFTSFAASDPDRAARMDIAPDSLEWNNVRTVVQSEWTRVANPGAGDPSELLYTIRGNGFLHHMVRNLVGTFLEIGRGRLTPDSIVEILNARDRSLAGPTAPARGLYLVRVGYAEKE